MRSLPVAGTLIDLLAVGFVAHDPRTSEESWIDPAAGATVYSALDPWMRKPLSPAAANRVPCLRSDAMIRHRESVDARQQRFDRTIRRWLNAVARANLCKVEFE